MNSVTLEILNGMYFPESEEGLLPTTYVELSIVPRKPASDVDETAAVKSSLRKETSLCSRSRQPKWGDRIVFDGIGDEETVLLRLLDRPENSSAGPRELGVHRLVVGGLHRRQGCAWVVFKAASVIAESPTPVLDTPCVRVVWSVRDNADFGSKAPVDPFASMQSATITTLRAATNRSLLSPSKSVVPADGEASPGSTTHEGEAAIKAELEKVFASRIRHLEERVDHLDSLFRTRRDYEAEVQRVMLENASKRAAAIAAGEVSPSSGDSTAGYASLATTPSAAVALMQQQQKTDALRSVQPSLMSVGATTNPWNIFRKQEPTTLPPSMASHFPLKWASPSSSSKSGSALQSILLQPTIVKTEDLLLLDSSTYKPVELPKPRLIGFVPSPFRPVDVNPVLPALSATARIAVP